MSASGRSTEVRIAVLGGSSAFTPALAQSLGDAGARLPALDVRLYGRDRERLAVVASMCDLVAQACNAPQRWTAAGSLAAACEDAAVVVNQMRVGGFAGRAHDERFPLVHGLPGDETIGPGGLASAIRGVPVVVAAAREAAAAAAPGAWFISLTNPMGILLLALRAVPGLRSIGLCELPAVTLRDAARRLSRTDEGLEADYIGLNHQGAFVRIASGGEELLPALARLAEPLMGDALGLRRDQALLLPYVRLLADPAGEARRLGERTTSRGAELAQLSDELIGSYRAAVEHGDPRLPAALARRPLPWIDGALVPALSALLGGGPRLLYVSERNGGDVPWLPVDAIVEKRCVLTPQGTRCRPWTGGPPPEPLIELLHRIVRFEQSALRAAKEPSEPAVVEALLRHPLAIPEPVARALAGDVLRVPPPLVSTPSTIRSQGAS